MLLTLAACSDSAMYYHYEGMQGDGWDKEDTLYFNVDSIRETGVRTISLTMRTTVDYPYKSVTVIVDENVMPGNAKRQFPVTLQVANDKGERNGSDGLTYYTVEKFVTRQQMKQGTSLSFKVHHDMQRLVLPGIKDIGIKIE